jgi:hypothetical protein
LLSRRAARTHLVASRHPKYFLRLHSAGSVSPGSGRPVRQEPWLRPDGSPQTLQTPPHGGRPVLRTPTKASPARTNSSRSTDSGRSSRRFPSPAPISRSHRASLASRPRSPIFLRPARHYPRLWLRTPLGVGPTGLPPASNTASPARTTTRSDCRSTTQPLPGITGYRSGIASRRPAGDGAKTALPGSHDDHSRVQRPLRRRVPQRPLLEQGHLPWPSPYRQRLGSLLAHPQRTGLHNDAYSGFTHVADRATASAPLRTRPLDHARGHRYQGPRRLPGPDSHRQAIVNLSLLRHVVLLFLMAPEQSRRT